MRYVQGMEPPPPDPDPDPDPDDTPEHEEPDDTPEETYGPAVSRGGRFGGWWF